MFGKSRSQRRAILSASSALALIAGLGGNAGACTNLTGPADFLAFENTGVLDCVSVTNGARVHGNLSNGSTGVIGPPASSQPATVSINNSTISGAVTNSGQILAGGTTPGGILVTGGSVVSSGVVNNTTGTISVSGTGGSAFGIKVSQSSFSGGITNNGVITVTNTGNAVGLVVGGSSPPPPPPPASINPGSPVITGSTVTTTNTSGGRKHRQP
ncbi:MAG: hypothetical protein ACREFI_00350 [Stellaceae bacterium]